MSFQAQPTTAGTYLVKVYNTDKNHYWKYLPDSDRRIQLTAVDESQKPSSFQFKWNITPVSGIPDAFTIRPAYDKDIGLVYSEPEPQKLVFPRGHVGSSANWKITKSADGKYAKIKVGTSDNVLDCRDSSTNYVHFHKNADDNAAKNQRFVFQLVEQVDKSFEQLWFQLTPEKAATEMYDIIVIGTGMGGGVIAGDLFDTNSKLGNLGKSVLVIEKGGLAFHSHCLNAARPSGFGEDRGQQNDTFFALFKDNYKFKDPNQSKEWKGGPMFNLGGRGAAWGLFAPRIHDDHLYKKLGKNLHDELVNTWYKKAEAQMEIFLPKTKHLHQNLMERLNFETGFGCQWQWGRIASEFSEPQNFDFATGAYSPIDKLLEIAMSKERKDDGTMVEHPKWKILLRTEVRRIIWDDKDGKRAIGVVIRDTSGNETNIFLKKDSSGKTLSDASIVLGAGSVGSPTILMRSGLNDFLKDPKNNALHLTDHEIFSKSVIFRYLDPSTREEVGSMKLQSYVHLEDGTIALVNIAIDSSSFLPRESLPSQFFRNTNFPQLIVAFIVPSQLNEKNTIDLDDNGEPVLTAGREVPFSNDDKNLKQLRKLTEDAIKTIKEALNIEIRPTDPDDDIRNLWYENYGWDDDNYFTPLQLGGVAHELGTLPLQCHDNRKEYLLDDVLKLRTCEGLFVCDLSIFPFSPEVNPTLTLVALALRLSRTLLNPDPFFSTQSPGALYVVNHTGERIKIFISNRAGVPLTQEEIDDNKKGKTLESGDIIARQRTEGVDETVMVYRLDYNTDKVFLPTPTPYIATPGRLCNIE